jgi:Ca-activated chloride channel family protein
MWLLAWWWVLALVPLPWLVRKVLPPASLNSEAALRPPAGTDFADLASAPAGGRGFPVKLLLLCLIWLALLLAAARPQYLGEPVSVPMTGRDLLLAVDLSGSMEERDFELAGRWVDRLTATKAVANDFIERRVGDRVGLILFGRNAYLQTPLTFDRVTVQTLLDESAIGLAGKETAIGDAIGLGIKTLDAAQVEQGRRVIVVLTDGANTAGEVEPLKAAELAAQRGVVIYTIGIGADEMMVRSMVFGSRRVNPSRDLDEKTLKAIAGQTGGQYFRARDTRELAGIYGILDELEPAAKDESGFRPVTELYMWPLGFGFTLAALWGFAAMLPARREQPQAEPQVQHG